VEDAKRAMEEGVDAIYLSNHGLVLFVLGSFLQESIREGMKVGVMKSSRQEEEY
jgi:isopentenyl diphosphate isomerase/L-lactate dehydrogenase-like FMN-dependent dehydrogenase